MIVLGTLRVEREGGKVGILGGIVIYKVFCLAAQYGH